MHGAAGAGTHIFAFIGVLKAGPASRSCLKLNVLQHINYDCSNYFNCFNTSLVPTQLTTRLHDRDH